MIDTSSLSSLLEQLQQIVCLLIQSRAAHRHAARNEYIVPYPMDILNELRFIAEYKTLVAFKVCLSRIDIICWDSWELLNLYLRVVFVFEYGQHKRLSHHF